MLKINKILMHIIKYFTICLCSLVPKNETVWVFGSWLGISYSDNPKYLYRYICSFDNNINAIWISKNNELVEKLQEKGIKAYYHKSLKGIYYQIVSKVVFVGHSVTSDLNSWCIGYNTKRVQLWHGIPLKKIGFDDQLFTTKGSLNKKIMKLTSHINNNNCDLFISTGERCSELFSSAFNVPKSKIIKTGFPRNDVFLNKEKPIKQTNTYRAIYMPTFRGNVGGQVDLFEQFGFDLNELEAIFTEHNINLTIKMHPANIPSQSIINSVKKSKCINFSEVDDIYEEINNYDCLITDYSSIMFDFVLSKKTILFAPFDFKDYILNDRELYFDYSVISKKIFSNNWKELSMAILNSKENFSVEKNKFLLEFHEVEINKSYNFSHNVYEYVLKNLSEI